MKSLILTGLLAWLVLQALGAPAPTTPPPAEAGATVGSEISILYLNSSCRARLLLDIRRKMLQAMGLEVEPHIPAGRAAAVRHLWSHHLMLLAGKQSSQHPNISSHEAFLTSKLNCTEVTYRVTINDLGWDSWVIHPKLFFYTDCMGCPCVEGVGITSTTEPEICRVDILTFQHEEQQVNCCKVTTSLTPFAYLDPGRGLMLRSVEMNQECRCGP
uniref:Gonadal-soma derived factor GSDF n=1 Tax=Hypselotriton orientalis TaxID=3399148 RepID=A0A6H0DX62_9SALA|nr:gonadal-soma derived factor GSDF [Cynops orientalis]